MAAETVSATPAAPTMEQVNHALTEALTMTESIDAVAEILIDNADARAFALLQAILSCSRRCRDAVAPVIESAHKQDMRDDAGARVC